MSISAERRRLNTAALSSDRKRGGIYLSKSGNLRSKLQPLLAAVDALVVLDEEMGVAVRDLDHYYRRRITHENTITRYFVIGEKHARKVRDLKPQLSERIRVTGWPRIDLWRPELSGVYADETNAISGRFAPFVLFTSDFGCISEQRIKQELRRLDRRGSGAEEKRARETEWRKDLQDYREFLQVLEELDRDPSTPTIVVRPHPAEDHAQWLRDTHQFSKIKVVYEGEITPWVLASIGVLHRGCTTAVQAYISGKPSMCWISEHGHRRTETLTYKVSTHLAGLDSLKQALSELKSSPVSSSSNPVGAITSEEVFLDTGLASERIAAELEALEVAPSQPFRISARRYMLFASKQLLNHLRISLGVALEKRRIDRHKRKFPENINQEEIDRMCKVIYPGRGFVSRRIFRNLFEIEAR